MSRVAAADVIEVKPTANVYTALVVAAALAELLAFLALYLKANEIFVDSAKSLFG
jgi:hypothetical protein